MTAVRVVYTDNYENEQTGLHDGYFVVDENGNLLIKDIADRPIAAYNNFVWRTVN